MGVISIYVVFRVLNLEEIIKRMNIDIEKEHVLCLLWKKRKKKKEPAKESNKK